MADTNRKRPTSVVTGPRRTPIEKLELIYALVTGPDRITPSLLRVKILAICEGRLIPADRKAFITLAKRAGVSQSKCYSTWDEYRAEIPIQLRSGPDATSSAPGTLNGESASANGRPRGTALYRYYDEADLLLYVGISDELSSRVTGHSKESSWMAFAARSTITRYQDRAEAADAEIEAIKTERPLFNQKHNNTPEARKRLVEYLIERERLDLLAPAV